ncbi:hypothetical protein [Allocoleopsis franciscana]|uniref:hypothetical protein n=1 Tax=Allocoleopsis franciscana TaxID=2886352 RepID=UPI00030CC126|nr:hypothetical protein [Allocoleopsis franciscana]
MGWPQTDTQGNDSRIRAVMAITAHSLLNGSKNLLAHGNWLKPNAWSSRGCNNSQSD